MTKKKLLIWGGNRKELHLENLDSHASVSAYFLTKYLSPYYDIVNLVDMDRPEQLLDHLEVDCMLSTFQYGFTSRVVKKDKQDLFLEIRKRFNGPLCSIVDSIWNERYYEDILFTVLPPPAKRNRKEVSEKCFNKNILMTRMGWSADPLECFPVSLPKGEINVFVDHPPYSSDSPDCTPQYFRAFKRFSEENPTIGLNVYQQNNQGIVKWNLDGEIDQGDYVRSNKVPWKEIIEYYQRTHVFCVTHPESAGLAVIEAAMCGAKMYIPIRKFVNPFISKKLIKGGITFTSFRHSPGFRDCSHRIKRAFERDVSRGFNREAIHQRLTRTNSWEIAARRIHSILSQKRHL